MEHSSRSNDSHLFETSAEDVADKARRLQNEYEVTSAELMKIVNSTEYAYASASTSDHGYGPTPEARSVLDRANTLNMHCAVIRQEIDAIFTA